jgi:pSer/pThr/pTyr-binding forkhead associated (FHA) protein
MSAFPAAYLVLTTDLKPAKPLPGVPGIPNVPAKGHAFQLQPGKNVIGRLPDPDIGIVLPEAGVSRRHSQVELLSTGWELEDLGSRNGTNVNGQDLQPHSLTLLNEGDRIHIARVELTFSLQPDWTDDRQPADREPSAEDIEKWLLGPYLNGDH